MIQSDFSPLVKQFCTKYSNLIKQPYLRFHISLHAILDKDGYSVDDVQETYLEHVIDAFVPLKSERKFALEDLDQTDTEFELIAHVANLELNVSGWSNN